MHSGTPLPSDMACKQPMFLNCFYGSPFSVEHALSCPMGVSPFLRHNEVRDLTANLMAEVYHNVSIEPHLQPLYGEYLHGASANTEAGARLDVAACLVSGEEDLIMPFLTYEYLILMHSQITKRT